MTSETDEDRWAEAQSLLDRTPSESAEQRLRRWRRLMIVVVAAVVVLTVALVTVLVAWTDEGVLTPDEVPLWREIAGLVVQLFALVVIVCSAVVQWRGNRRRMAWRSPLVALTRQQRKALWARVRRDAYVPPERLPLARFLAATVDGQGVTVVLYLGILLQSIGLFLVSPSTWQLIWLLVLGGFAVVSVPLVVRNTRRARRFLDTHQAPDDSVA